ncbi:MAG: DNA topoisomerase IA [Gammaproteobacteria bacterium]|jgi:DNA topoisomerase IA
MTQLMIVESPPKIAKIELFLSEGWLVKASYDHTQT